MLSPQILAAISTNSFPNLQDMVSHWKLNEESGERVDSFGQNNLTDNNTVTQLEGKIDYAGQFAKANSEYLSIASNADVSCGDIDFTWAVWVYFDSDDVGNAYILSKGTLVPDAIDYALYDSGIAAAFTFKVGNKTVNSAINPGTATWYFVVAWHDNTADTINIQVDDGTVNSTSTITPATNATNFYIGAVEGSAGAFNFHNGRIDSVSFWKRVLTADERTQLYNGGQGLDFPQ